MVVFLLTIAANKLYSQDYGCKRWPPVPQVITVENVQQLCNLGADPGRIIEARWHKNESILVLWNLDVDVTLQTPSHFSVWDVENFVSDFGVVDGSLSQLELASERIIMGTDEGSLKFWDIVQKKFLFELPIHDGAVSELLLHPSEKWLAVVINQSKLFRYGLKTRSVDEVHLQGNEDATVEALAFSSDGRLLAVAGTEAIGIWDTTDWVVRGKATLGSDVPVSLHFTDDDTRLIMLADVSVSRWSLTDDGLDLVRTLEPHRPKRQCMLLGGDINPDKTLLMTTDDCGQLRAWDLELDQEINVPQFWYIGEDHVGVPTRFSLDGRYLVDRVEPYGFMLLIVPEPE